MIVYLMDGVVVGDLEFGVDDGLVVGAAEVIGRDEGFDVGVRLGLLVVGENVIDAD